MTITVETAVIRSCRADIQRFADGIPAPREASLRLSSELSRYFARGRPFLACSPGEVLYEGFSTS
jgi:hypothetical protein